MRKSYHNKLIAVCSECRTASCWYGEFQCDRSLGAGIVLVKRSYLAKEKREHPLYWSSEKLLEVCGSAAPNGYAK